MYHWNAVTAGYFTAMRIPVLEGTGFSGPEAAEVIVNPAFVSQNLGGRHAVGTVFRRDRSKEFRIVGVVRGTKNMTMGEGDQPQMYEALAQ